MYMVFNKVVLTSTLAKMKCSQDDVSIVPDSYRHELLNRRKLYMISIDGWAKVMKRLLRHN